MKSAKTETVTGDPVLANRKLLFAALIILFSFALIFQATRLSAQTATHGDDMSDSTIERSENEWREIMTPEQYHVCRERGTERAFTGEYWNTHTQGVYRCAGCGQALFSSEHKYDSGSGWPSFWQPYDTENVATSEDRSLFMRRTEVHCSRCGSHLGHVFDDGPRPTGKRYCINSIALELDSTESAGSGE